MFDKKRRSAHTCNGQTSANPWHLQLIMPARGEPVRLARDVTSEVLTAWRLAHVQETAVLMVSELVTSAVRDSESSDVITLELQNMQTCLRI